MGIFRKLAVLSLVVAGSLARAEDLPLDYKILIDEATIPVALQGLRHTRVSTENSNLYFFDTKDLKLFGAGLVIRARDVVGSTGEVMVKARPLEESDLDESWFDIAGLACDVDATPIKVSPACSIRLPKSTGDILSVVNEITELDDLLSQDQIFFANDFGGYDTVSKKVHLLGPIAASRWKVPNQQGWKVMAELWQLPNGTQFLEISIRGMESDHQRLAAAMRTFLKDRSLVAASSTLNKTANALKILSK